MIEDVKSAVEGALGKVGGVGELPPAKILGGARLAVGLTGVLAPGLSSWVIGLRPGRNPPVSYLMRLNGTRNAALGAAVLAGPEAARPLLIQLGLATDILALMATKRARGKGNIGIRTTLVAGLTELALAGLGGAVVSGKL